GHGKRRVMKQSRSAFALLRITTAARWKLTLAWYGKWICRSAVCCRLWKLRGSPTTQSSFSPVITAASGFPTHGRLRERKWNCSKAAYAFLPRSEEHTSELQSRSELVCRLLLEKKKSPLTFIQNL